MTNTKILRLLLTLSATAGLLAAISGWSVYQSDTGVSLPADDKVNVARFNTRGDLIRPEQIERWVFLGASLGMGYNKQIPFNSDTPGNFQTVLMEPQAYQMFDKTGQFPDGAMFALLFHRSETDISINQSGFVMGDPLALEIHLKDRARFPETGFNFYFFGENDGSARTRETPNDCTNCHIEHGAYQSVFTQFYPTLRNRVGLTPDQESR